MTLNRRQFTRHTIASSAALETTSVTQISWAQSGKIYLEQSRLLTSSVAHNAFSSMLGQMYFLNC